MNVKKDILWRVYVSFLLVLLLAGAIVGQMIKLQTVKHAALASLADSLTTSFFNIQPIRGNIYASDGSLLATSIPIYEARMDMRVSNLPEDEYKEELDSLSFCLANYFKDKTKADYKNELLQAYKKKERYHLLKRRLTHTQIKDLMTFPLFRLGRYKSGLIAEQKSHRILPFQQLGQRTIGYTREEVQPVGLEGAFDSYLSGKTGKRLMQKASGGVWVPINDENELDPKDGQDVFTTIDVNFQDITEAALQKALVTNGAEHGCAIVMEVGTGKIKAIANLTQDGDDNYIEKYNYAIGASTEPGSTFKLASVMALLELKKASPTTLVDTKNGMVEYNKSVMHDAEKGGHGIITLQRAFEVSSNVGISQAVYNAFSREPAKFTDFIYSLGLNHPLGLPIAGEGIPVVKTPRDKKNWSGTTLPYMSIGYEIRLTPLQILTLYNAVANNGVMVKPEFVTEIREVGKTVKSFNTEVINPQICSAGTLRDLKKMMEGVVESGTADNIKNSLYPIAGKTGTAQIAQDQNGYGHKEYQSSFVGYFPANKPMYSIIVTISSPSKGAYYGSAVAAPVFKEISDKIYAMTATTHSYLASFESPQKTTLPLASVMNQENLSSLLSLYQNDNTEQVASDKSSWVRPKQEKDHIALTGVEIKKAGVPDVKGMALSDAIYLLENAGLKVRFSGKGKVTQQSIQPGTIAGSGQIIELLLG
jgi:cell division protein FtsI (penicillin-binding protein 3)